jgi:hypothetical protein
VKIHGYHCLSLPTVKHIAEPYLMVCDGGAVLPIVNEGKGMTTKVAQSRLILLTDWNRYHDWPTQGTLRHYAQYRATNGFGSAFLKVQRRILIKENEFYRCVNRLQEREAYDAAAA